MVMLEKWEIELLISTKTDCLNYGGIWRKFDSNFDDVITAVI